jgi:hypothetical protein
MSPRRLNRTRVRCRGRRAGGPNSPSGDGEAVLARSGESGGTHAPVGFEPRGLGVVETRTRAEGVHIRMTKEEHAMLKAIAKDKGFSISDVVRQYVRREHAKLVKRGEA